MSRLSVLLGLLALTPTLPRAQPYETDSLTIALYHLDEVAGTTAYDSSGNDLDATAFGGTWTPEGKFGGGITLDGDDNLLVPSTDLLPTLELTLEAWVFRSADVPGVLIDCRGFGFPLNDGPYLGIDAFGRAYASFLYGHVGIFIVTGTTSLPVDTWVHVAGIFAGQEGTLGVAVNGVVEAESAYDAAPIGRNGALIGSAFNVGGDPHFVGRLDEVRISSIARIDIPTGIQWSSARLTPELQVIRRPGVSVLRFTLPRPDIAMIDIYNVRGHVIDRIIAGPLSAGLHEIPWRGLGTSGVETASGIYVVRLSTSSGQIDSAKLLNVR